MIKVGPELIEYVDQLERERSIPRDFVLNSLKEAMLAAFKRYGHRLDVEGFECQLNEKTGEIGIYQIQTVVEEVDPENEANEMSLAEARRLKADIEVGDILEMDVTPEEFGRIAAQSAKQVITQRIREAEKMLIQREFEEKRGTVTTGIVQRIEGRNVIINIGKSEAVLPPREQIPGEYYRVGNKLRVFVADIRESGRVPQIVVSQAHPVMVREVFELEVPEIEDGLVEIKNIAREAGYRTKVAVSSNDPDVDPQGACIGTRGSRIQAIVNELKNEKIDIIRWSPSPEEFITHALAPAKIVNVIIDEEAAQPHAIVVVPDDQLSLAIGREGQNVRLAAKLTNFKLDIKSLSQMQAEMHDHQEHYEEPMEMEAMPQEETRMEDSPQAEEVSEEQASAEQASTEEVFEEEVEEEFQT
jgi:N utilization substance protein A